MLSKEQTFSEKKEPLGYCFVSLKPKVNMKRKKGSKRKGEGRWSHGVQYFVIDPQQKWVSLSLWVFHFHLIELFSTQSFLLFIYFHFPKNKRDFIRDLRVQKPN